MLKHVIVFVAICLAGIGYFKSEVFKIKSVLEIPVSTKPGFVSLKEGKFILEGKPFYMMALNFIVSLRVKDTLMWPSIFVGYVNQEGYHENDPDACYKELKANFQLVRDMGFNTLRVTSIGEAQIEDKVTGKMHFVGSSGTNYHYTFQLDDGLSEVDYFVSQDASA